MNNVDDSTILITHDANNAIPTDDIWPKDANGVTELKNIHLNLPFMSTYQTHPFISILRTLYYEVSHFTEGTLPEVRQLKQNLIQIMDNHTRLLSEQGIENTHVMIIRYMIATFIDDRMSHLPWQQNIAWADNSLLHYYYQETYGGEKFFQLLGQFAKEPNKYIQHIELAFICISLGYEGKYAINKDSKGKVELEKIRNELYSFIRNYASKEEKFYEGHPVSNKQNKLSLHIPYKLFMIGGLVLVSIVYGIFTNTVSTNENTLLETINFSHKVKR